MPNTIYSIQENLDSILDIKQTKYEYTDAELFDCSDYPNDGKSSGHFDRTGMSHTEETKRLIGLKSMGNKSRTGMKVKEETSRKMSQTRMGNQNARGNKGKKQSEEHIRKRMESFKKTMQNRKLR